MEVAGTETQTPSGVLMGVVSSKSFNPPLLYSRLGRKCMVATRAWFVNCPLLSVRCGEYKPR